MELQDQMLLTVTTKSGKEIVLNVDVLEPTSKEAEVEVVVNESSIGFTLVVRREDLSPRVPTGQRAWANAVATGSDR